MVSVIIPVYNAEKYLARAINSVISQTYRDFEVVCVDDASRDRSRDIILEYEKVDQRIRHLFLEINRGPAIARNMGISMARGNYILPLDSDDYLDPTFIQKAIDVFTKNETVSVVYSKIMLVTSSGENRPWILPEFSYQIMTVKNVVPITAIFRKSDWEYLGGYNPNMKWGYEDWDFWLKFVEKKKTFYQIPEYLFYYQANEEGRSIKLGIQKKKLKQTLRQLRKNHPDLFRFYRTKIFFKTLFTFFYTKKTFNSGQTLIKVFKIPIYKKNDKSDCFDI